MASPQFPNYLLSNRKQFALSQDEIAFLLGASSGREVCRHERFRSLPSLEVALAYEIIFKLSVSEIFGGQYAQIDAEVKARAKVLLAKTNGQKRFTRRADHRRRALAEIAGIRS